MDDGASPAACVARTFGERGLPVLILHEPGEATRCSCGHGDCASPAKHPRTSHGLHDATTDLEIIERWWARWPTANIGMRTGLTFDVFDVDPDGLDELFDHYGNDDAAVVTDGPCVRTPRGGVHLYCEATGLGNKAGFRP